MTTDDTSPVNPPPVTLGDLRAVTASLPDSTPLVIETCEDDDYQFTYERLALALCVKVYPGGATTIALGDIPEGRVA
jgi:hypothetical protein